MKHKLNHQGWGETSQPEQKTPPYGESEEELKSFWERREEWKIGLKLISQKRIVGIWSWLLTGQTGCRKSGNSDRFILGPAKSVMVIRMKEIKRCLIFEETETKLGVDTSKSRDITLAEASAQSRGYGCLRMDGRATQRKLECWITDGFELRKEKTWESSNGEDPTSLILKGISLISLEGPILKAETGLLPSMWRTDLPGKDLMLGILEGEEGTSRGSRWSWSDHRLDEIRSLRQAPGAGDERSLHAWSLKESWHHWATGNQNWIYAGMYLSHPVLIPF